MFKANFNPENSSNKELISAGLASVRLLQEADRELREKGDSVYIDAIGTLSAFQNIPPGFEPIFIVASTVALPHLISLINEEIEHRKENGRLTTEEQAELEAQFGKQLEIMNKIIQLKQELQDE